MEYKIAVIVVGTLREVQFLLEIFPYMAGNVEHDIFVTLRHVRRSEKSRLGGNEPDFELKDVACNSRDNVFFTEMASFEKDEILRRYVIPTGPNTIDKECGILSMFHGVFSAISAVKSSLRSYTHVFKLRTDYFPERCPWLENNLKHYYENRRKTIVDRLATIPVRYPDRLNIPWQGSISDILTFTSFDQFMELWDVEEILPRMWTGVPETTLFRSAMYKILGDELQSERRNTSFLDKYFVWDKEPQWHPKNEFKTVLGQSRHIIRYGVLSDDYKEFIIQLCKRQKYGSETINSLLKNSYMYLLNEKQSEEFSFETSRLISSEDYDDLMRLLHECRESFSPV